MQVVLYTSSRKEIPRLGQEKFLDWVKIVCGHTERKIIRNSMPRYTYSFPKTKVLTIFISIVITIFYLIYEIRGNPKS